jgi:hypothetical protein
MPDRKDNCTVALVCVASSSSLAVLHAGNMQNVFFSEILVAQTQVVHFSMQAASLVFWQEKSPRNGCSKGLSWFL